MTILLTSDLHIDRKKLRWLLDDSPEHPKSARKERKRSGERLPMRLRARKHHREVIETKFFQNSGHARRSQAQCRGTRNVFHQISAYARIREHDALLAAGDLLDMFSDTSFTEQKSTALIWKNTVLKSGKSLAWCSGNHDFFRGDCTPMSLASPFWMRESPSNRFFITDGESRLLETSNGRIAVTTLPWPAHGSELVVDGYRTTYVEFVANLLSAGKKIKDEKGVPWIVLNHEPPGGTPLSATDEAPEANLPRKLIEVAQPDFSLHGHIHQAPTAKDGSWIWQFGETVCFNPGQSLPGEPLHYIVLNWRAPGDWTATWSGAGRMLCVESDTKNSS